MNIDISSSKEASMTVPDREIGFVFGKLAEEYGEFVASINQPHRSPEDYFGEGADVLNCVLDLIFLATKRNLSGCHTDEEIYDISIAELNRRLPIKAAKWVKKATS